MVKSITNDIFAIDVYAQPNVIVKIANPCFVIDKNKGLIRIVIALVVVLDSVLMKTKRDDKFASFVNEAPVAINTHTCQALTEWTHFIKDVPNHWYAMLVNKSPLVILLIGEK